MLEAISEKTGKRITGYYSRDELEQEILKESVEDDFWDVIENGSIAYYFTP